jgi:cytoskeletal protein RodZ
MNPQYYGLIELVLVFGGLLAFFWWQMHSLKRAKAEREAREEAEADQPEPGEYPKGR